MIAQPPRSHTRLAIAILVAALVIGAAIYSSSYFATTRTITKTTTATVTTTISNTASTALLAGCVNTRVPDFGFGTVTAGYASPALICIQLYYYNSTAPLTLNLTSAIQIEAQQYISSTSGGPLYSRSFNGASNFTIISSQNQLVIGGPSNESEGVFVAYAITAKPGASGAYQIGFDAWFLGSQMASSCNSYGELAAGSGKPDYIGAGYLNCTTTPATSGYYSVSGIPYPVLSGLYFRTVGITNSTD
jgi:hypothetical protein